MMGIEQKRRNKRFQAELLRTLNMLGKWEIESRAAGVETPHRTLTFTSGTLSTGQYVARDDDAVERGDWRLNGHTLTLAATEGHSAVDGPKRNDLRLFEDGRIGLDGPGRQREIYSKRESDIVPLAHKLKQRG